MVVRLSCIESERLPELLGTTEPARDLLEHLSNCPQCQTALECLAVGESAWLRSPTIASGVVDSPSRLRQVISALKQFSTASDLLAVPPNDLSLEFLGPTDYPDSLGAVGPYPVLEIIGRGGMGVVFRAIDRALNRVIAVKVLAPQWAANGTARQRFLREARAAAAVAHEHVVYIHAVDEANGLPYLVMEYVPGLSLQERIDRDGPLDPKDIARIALQVAEGLSAAHAQGLVHRDVKPANILMENGVGRARLSDFGLARAVDDAGATQHGTIAGTPDYMAPEQATAQVVDHRADLYSLGCVIYAMSTGRPPFRAATALGVLHLTATAVPLPIRAANPDVPPDLEELALRLLAKDPSDRFPSAAAVAAELREVLVRMQHPNLRPPPRRRRYWRLVATGATLVLIAAVIFVPRLRDEEPKVTTDPSEPSLPKESIRLAPTQERPIETPPVPPEDERPMAVPESIVVRTFDGHGGSIRGLAVHPDGKRFVSVTGWPRGDGTIRIWDMANGKETHRIAVGLLTSDCTTLTPTGDTIIAGFTDGTIRLYGWDSETEQIRLGGDRGEITCAAAAPTGRRIAAGDSTGRVRVWDPATGRPILTIPAHSPRQCRGIKYSPDGKSIATVGLDGVVRTWDAATGKKRIEASVGSGGVFGVCFAESGRKLITVGGEGAAVWDPATGHRLFDLRDGKLTALTCVTASPEGTTIASGGHDGYVRIWDLGTGRLLHREAAGVGAVWAVAFTPEGNHVLTGGGGVVLNREYVAGDRFTIRMWSVRR